MGTYSLTNGKYVDFAQGGIDWQDVAAAAFGVAAADGLVVAALVGLDPGRACWGHGRRAVREIPGGCC